MSRSEFEDPKQLLDQIPPGFVVDSGWLRLHHVPRRATHDYLKRNGLQAVAPGVYRKPVSPNSDERQPLDWRVPVLSAQRIMGYRLHIGGPTALRLHGHLEGLPLGRSDRFYAYGDVPVWFAGISLNARVKLRNTRLFNGVGAGIQQPPANAEDDPGQPTRWPLRLSCPERALLEALDEMEGSECFKLVTPLFDRLSGLDADVMTGLLQKCSKTKVKRLFFVFADQHHHAWLRNVDHSGIDLGSGDRVFFKDGEMHPKYRITVPADYLPLRSSRLGA